MNKQRQVAGGYRKRGRSVQNSRKTAAGRGGAGGKEKRNEDFSDEDEFKKNSKKYDREAQVDDDEVKIEDDEEIDEDLAFAEEDYALYGDIGKKQNNKRPREEVEAEPEEDEEDSEEDDDDDTIYKNLSDLVDEEDTAIDQQKHQQLINKITEISNPKKKPKVEIMEFTKEGEFNRPAVTSKITLDDLVNKLENVTPGTKQALQGVQSQKPVEEPLAPVKRDRLLRKTQYQITSDEISEWDETIKAMKDAPSLTFPLAEPHGTPVPSVAKIASNFRPLSDMEREIQQLTSASDGTTNNGEEEGVTITSEDVFSSLEISKEDLQERIGKEAKLRNILLYKERKAKLHKKIKSRTYRKILRKQKEKHKLTLEELKELDPAAANEEMLKLEQRRALERVTLRHKTTGGKWARKVSKVKNPIMQQRLAEANSINRDLVKKINRVKEDDEDDDEEDESDIEPPQTEAPPMEGLMAMKFMQRGLQREREEYLKLKEQYNKDVEETIKKLDKNANKLRGIEDEDEEDEEEEDEENDNEESKQLRRQEQRQQQEEQLRRQVQQLLPVSNPTRAQLLPQPDPEIIEIKVKEHNPWMKVNEGQTPPQPTAKSTKRPTKDQSKDSDPTRRNSVDSLQLDLNKLNKKVEESARKSRRDPKAIDLMGNKEQQEFILSAFANDNVEAEFAKEKQRTIDDQLPQEDLNLHMPGWGSWGGCGIEWKPNAQDRAKLEARALKEEDIKSKRKDKQLNHVIINETKNTAVEKYKAFFPSKGLSPGVYEKTMLNPLGKEWNTVSSYKKMIVPRVITKTGSVIDPIQHKVK